ncbi:MAG: hypothetical protein KY463_16525 [Actinobacteria bacterium]|nr:hypothetical protein [Actinomycetota bacterium]
MRRARAAPRSGTLASVFAEIYSGQPRPLPDSVSQALAALALAREPRRAALRDARRGGGGEAPGREFLLG